VAKKKIKETTQTPENLSDQLIVHLVTKITELDTQVANLVSAKLGAQFELMDQQNRIEILEEQMSIIKKKFEQSRFPSLLDEFLAYKNKNKKVVQKSKSLKKL